MSDVYKYLCNCYYGSKNQHSDDKKVLEKGTSIDEDWIEISEGQSHIIHIDGPKASLLKSVMWRAEANSKISDRAVEEDLLKPIWGKEEKEDLLKPIWGKEEEESRKAPKKEEEESRKAPKVDEGGLTKSLIGVDDSKKIQEDEKIKIKEAKKVWIDKHVKVLQEFKANLKFVEFFKNNPIPVDLDRVINLNEIKDRLIQAPSGAYLYHHYDSDLEVALDKCIEEFFGRILKDKKGPEQSRASNQIVNSIENDKSYKKTVKDLCRNILIKSALYDPQKYVVFYHGHGNGLRLYFDMLREIKAFENIESGEGSNPLRDKDSEDKVSTVEKFLESYEGEVEKEAEKQHLDFLNLSDFGYGLVPDSVPYFRDHAICANFNLFSNMHDLLECTLFYFLDSFNVSNPNQFLVEKLLKRVSSSHIVENKEKFDIKVRVFMKAHQLYMEKAGGNLMQIAIPREKLNELVFPAWAKGVPLFVDDKGQVIVRDQNPKRPPQTLKPQKGYYLPNVNQYIDLFVKNPDEFAKKYTVLTGTEEEVKEEKKRCIDRQQVRMVIAHDAFNSGEIKMDQFTKETVSECDMGGYREALDILVGEIREKYLDSSRIDAYNTRLRTLNDYMK